VDSAQWSTAVAAATLMPRRQARRRAEVTRAAAAAAAAAAAEATVRRPPRAIGSGRIRDARSRRLRDVKEKLAVVVRPILRGIAATAAMLALRPMWDWGGREGILR
jgi:hypothetical protein